MDPDYPPDARRLRLEDTVIVSALVSERGSVQSVRVLKGSRKTAAFDAAAVAAVRQWSFAPARRKGKPVASSYNVALHFKLE